MYALVEASTTRGARHFIVSGGSGPAAEATLRALLDRGEQVKDRTGAAFEAAEVDSTTIVAQVMSPTAGFAIDGQSVVGE